MSWSAGREGSIVRPKIRVMSVLAGGAGSVLLLGGCGGAGGSGDGGSAVYGGSAARASAGPSSATSPSGVAGPVTTVTATETEFNISLSQTAFKAGSYTFNVVNHGNSAHNLTIAGPGVTSLASPTSQGGGSGALSVTLQAGSYELWCGVDSHRTKGMDIKITVA